MQEERVGLKVAKLAKEKMFDLDVDSYYENDKLFTTNWEEIWDVVTYEQQENNTFIERLDYNTYENHYSAPTQSLLQQWLREKHDIFVEVNIKHRNLKRYFFYSISYANNSYEGYSEVLYMWLGLGVEENEIYHVYVTHKQALEKGILKALKLIKL